MAKRTRKIAIEVDVHSDVVRALMEAGYEFGDYGDYLSGDIALDRLKEVFPHMLVTIDVNLRSKSMIIRKPSLESQNA